ncbi:hypothetical protein ACWEOS_31785 [Micromonospora taraxaci]
MTRPDTRVVFGTDIDCGMCAITINTLTTGHRIAGRHNHFWRQHMQVQRLALKLSMAFAVTAALVATGSPASAAVNDDDNVTTWDYNKMCQAGRLDFVDYGEGAPGGGMNDDYFVVRDTCANGDGVLARVYVNGVLAGTRYNGGGNGSSIIWDPAQVYANDVVEMRICGAMGPNDTSGYSCVPKVFRSVDG